MPAFQQAEISMSIRKNQLEANKLQKRLRRNVGSAIADYNMIEEATG